MERVAEPASSGSFDLVCLGEPMLELNLQPSVDPERRLYLEAHGGDASNVAVAAARQGARVAFLSAVGDDPAGRSFLDLWRREAIDSTAVRVDPDHHTGLYFVRHDAGGHHFSYLRRGSAASRYRLDEAGLAVLARSASVFASGISLGISDRAADTVFAAMHAVRAAGGRVAFDTNYRPKLWPRARAAAVIGQGMRLADVVFPGLEDATLLLGLSDPDAILDLCLGFGAETVMLKMGRSGAMVATRDGTRVAVAPHPCVPVDATGAGDTFCGAVLARLAVGDAPVEAARYAACAAALATTGYGAVPPIPTRAAVLAELAGRG